MPKKKVTEQTRNPQAIVDDDGVPPPLPIDLLDELIAAAGGPGKLTGSDGLLKRLTAALVSRALNAEMSEHLGYAEGEEPPPDQGNRRNGHRQKTLRTDRGPVVVEVPRDREGSFEPKLVPKHQRSFNGFDDQILSMYSRGMSTRDIQRHLQDIYGVEVSPDLVTRVTDDVVDELTTWRSRPLEKLYPIVYLDALVTKIRDKGKVENKSIYVVVGVDLDGRKDVLGLWLQHTEGAKFWLSILTELQSRGVEDILVLCADGLTGMAEAVAATFPKTIFQTCIVHLIRASTRYVPQKDLRAVCADMRAMYTAPTVDAAKAALSALDAKWGARFPHAVKSWRDRLDEWTPFLDFPLELRRVIYTTNAIEALNRQLRKALKTRGPLPTDDAALKLVYLAIRNAQARWGRGARDWGAARAQLVILFEERFSEA